VVYHRGPLTRETSAGCAPKGARPPAIVAAQEATFARCAGLDQSSNRARISFRLQKLTSGARSRRPRVNSPSPPSGSSSSLREQTRRAKERRKPARGGKAARTVAGSLRESGNAKAVGRALVDGRRLGSGKPPALTRGRWKRSWRFANTQQWVSAGRDRGRQRPDHRPSARLTTPRQGSPACARGSSPPH
jgi:hypothetical protein